jgi:hypothetical protein
VKYVHVITLVPAGVTAGLCPHGITTPAMVDPVLVQVEHLR